MNYLTLFLSGQVLLHREKKDLLYNIILIVLILYLLYSISPYYNISSYNI